MKKLLLVLAVAALSLTACQKKAAEVAEQVYSVDEVIAAADSLVGDTISFEGMCTHLCKHGGRKAFLMGSDEEHLIMAEGSKMGNFAPECVNNRLRVKAVVCVFEYIPEEAEHCVEELQKHGENDEGCETEQKAVRQYYTEAISYEILNEE